jgi:hypothetical protein
VTPFASVALIRRNGSVVFKPPRKERPDDLTQARKAAVRYWRGNLAAGDALVKVIIVREFAGKLEISESARAGSWIGNVAEIATAAREPHIAACLGELGIDATADAAPAVPDVLTINGFTYRRDI